MDHFDSNETKGKNATYDHVEVKMRKEVSSVIQEKIPHVH